MKRQRISKHITNFDKWDLEGNIERTILRLREKLDYLKSEYTEYDTFSFNFESDYYEEYLLKIYGNRDETDEEYGERLKEKNQKKRSSKIRC